MEELLHLLREKGERKPHPTYFEGLEDRIVTRLSEPSHRDDSRFGTRARSPRSMWLWGPVGGAVALIVWAVWVTIPGEGPAIDNAQAVEPETESIRMVDEASGVSTNGAPAGLFDPNSNAVLPASGR